jgi:hypothetical protein
MRPRLIVRILHQNLDDQVPWLFLQARKVYSRSNSMAWQSMLYILRELETKKFRVSWPRV